MGTVTQGGSMVHWMPQEMSEFLSSPQSGMTLSNGQLKRRSTEMEEEKLNVLREYAGL